MTCCAGRVRCEPPFILFLLPTPAVHTEVVAAGWQRKGNQSGIPPRVWDHSQTHTRSLAQAVRIFLANWVWGKVKRERECRGFFFFFKKKRVISSVRGRGGCGKEADYWEVKSPGWIRIRRRLSQRKNREVDMSRIPGSQRASTALMGMKRKGTESKWMCVRAYLNERMG